MTFEEFWDDAGWHKDFKDDLEEVWNAAQQAELDRLQPVIEALQECSDAMVYMSVYDIPFNLPLRVSKALRIARGER